MDEIEVRVPNEINDYHEKFYGLTLRQIIAVILMAIFTIPTYIYLSQYIGSDPASYIIIAIACPFAFFGFVKIQGLDAEKIIPFWYRNYLLFTKPLIFKTQKEINAEIEAKKQAKKNKKNKKDKAVATTTIATDTVENTVVENESEIKVQQTGEENAPVVNKAELKKQRKLEIQAEKEAKRKAKIDEANRIKAEKIEAKRVAKEEKENRKRIKAIRKQRAELEEARKKFGYIEEPKNQNTSSLNENDIAMLKNLATFIGRGEIYATVQEEKTTETESNQSEE